MSLLLYYKSSFWVGFIGIFKMKKFLICNLFIISFLLNSMCVYGVSTRSQTLSLKEDKSAQVLKPRGKMGTHQKKKGLNQKNKSQDVRHEEEFKNPVESNVRERLSFFIDPHPLLVVSNPQSYDQEFQEVLRQQVVLAIINNDKDALMDLAYNMAILRMPFNWVIDYLGLALSHSSHYVAEFLIAHNLFPKQTTIEILRKLWENTNVFSCFLRDNNEQEMSKDEEERIKYIEDLMKRLAVRQPKEKSAQQ